MRNFLRGKSVKVKGKVKEKEKILAAGISLFALYISFVFVSQCKKESSKSQPPTQVEGLSGLSDKDTIKAPNLDEAISEVSFPQNINIKVLKKEDIRNLNPIPPEYGGAFKAKEGDILVETDKIRAIIQRPSREVGVSTYGGNIIDIDIKREDGKFHDILGEENWFWFLGHTIKPQKIGVLEGKQNVIVVLGELDLLDYINANGLAGTVFRRIIPNYQLPFVVDEVKPLKVAKYFVFSDGRYIKIIDVVCNTSQNSIEKFFFADIIDSGGSGEFFIPSSDLQGFGYVSPLPTGLSVFKMNGFSFVSEEVDSSYGIFNFRDGNFTEDNVVLIVSGVALIGYGMLDGDPLNSLLQVAMGGSKKFLELKPSECIMNQKYFIVGNGSPSSLSDELFKIRQSKEKNLSLYEIQGKVNMSDLPYLPSRPRIAVFRENNLITTAIADLRGNFKLILPEGEYKFFAEIKELPPSQPQIVKVPEQLKVQFDLGKTAKVIVSAVEVFEKDGNVVEKNIPAKVSFLCIGTCPKTICKGKDCEVKSTSFRDYVYDPLPNGVQEVVFLAKGEKTEVNLPPGKYRVVVSRGMEYSRYETEVSLSAGSQVEIKAILHRVADTPGWLSADTHVHAVNSPDSPVSLIDRVITFAAEGVDVIISTDHDWLTDYEPAIKLVGIPEFLASLVGQEITTFSYGHFNAYPLIRDETKSSDGALDWAEKYDKFQKYGISESDKEKYRFLRSLHPREIFKNAHLMKPDNFKRNIVQVNHPRSGGMGYFDYVLVNTLDFTTAQDPCMHRIFPPAGLCGTSKDIGKDTGLFVPLDILSDMNNPERFDAIELYNSYYEIPIVLNDWFTFLNHGIHITAVACSDTHQKVQVVSGIGRTFVWVGPGNDSAQRFREDILIKSAFIDNLADGKVFITNGIILDEFKVCGFQGGSEVCAEMGRSNMKNIISGFKIKLKLKSADWVNFDTIRVFINTPKTAVRSGEVKKDFPEPYFISQITPLISEKNVGGFSFKWREFYLEVPINPPAEDFWVVVMVNCEKECETNPMFPVITDKKVKPILITNPIYIDQNGDGKFNPPKPTYADSGIERRAPELKIEKDIKKYDIREIKEIFMKVLDSLHIH